MGCAPSAEILAEWNRREGELIAANASADRDVAKPPEPKGAHTGTTPESIKDKVAREGARTIPVRDYSLILDQATISIENMLTRASGPS